MRWFSLCILLLVSLGLSLGPIGCSGGPTTEFNGGNEDTTDSGSSSEDVTDGGNETIPETTPETQKETTPEAPADEAPKVERYRFPGEVVKCTKNEAFEALGSILAGGKNNPTGRGEQGAVYDPCNKRILLFGGNDYQPKQCADFGPKRFKGDTWTYVAKYKNWVRIKTSAAPQARGRHAYAYDLSRKKFYIFGGRFRAEASSGRYTLFGDLWAFDANTDTWKEVITSGDKPSARSNSAMIYDYLNDRLILFGGNTSTSGLSFFPLNDTYTLDLKTMAWKRVISSAVPRSRLFHSVVMDSKNQRMVMYGGGGANAFTGPFYSDVWGLNLKTLQWEELWKKTASNNGPPARIKPVLLEDANAGRVIMFAGHDDTAIGHRNDLWTFDSAQKTWQLKKAGDTGTGSGCASFCRCNPDFVEVDDSSPERRQYHTMVPILGEQRAILFGGKTDCGYIDDTWTLSFENFGWTEINAASQGEACKRTGRANCKELCY